MDDSSQYFYSSPTSPGEPHFTTRQAMASFENLVALANYQERLKSARQIVWRDRGQPVAELPSLKDCLEHAATGAFRSATLAFNIRASLNVVLALIRLHRVPKDERLKLIRNAIFGSDSLRFAAMLGTFAAVYKFLLNALPIFIPAINPRPRPLSSPFYEDDEDEEEMDLPRTVSYPASGPPTPLHRRRSARLSLSAHAQMALVRKRTRRWHAALAGAIAGSLAIMWEKRSRRVVIAQQMFVRGLQGSYNAYSGRHGINIPYGSVMVFAFACGQIMYGYTMRPDTLPRSYINWIQGAGHLSTEAVRINHFAVREHRIDLPSLDTIIARADATPSNAAYLQALRENVLAGAPVPHYVPCEALHPKLTSCWSVAPDRFVDVFRYMLPIYSALHFLPPILLRWRQFRADPTRLLVRSGLGSLRSSAFLGLFVLIYQGSVCVKHQTYERLMSSPIWRKLLPQSVIDLLISKPSFWMTGFLAGLAILVEEDRRRAELAMYVLPKSLESVWVAARGRGLVFRTGNWGESVLTGLAMGLVMSTYQNDPEHLSGLVRRILYQFIGPN
ncbi:WD-repeats-region domain-containing protein [Favolaschia claudopus]|uniref:WD-repeats-region domain-containing protein n=1 Tax=Favolaschia claudopus TaxID=2862362 RepID=A0AAW0D066_9AGAR